MVHKAATFQRNLSLLLIYRWRWQVPLKQSYFSARLHCVMVQETNLDCFCHTLLAYVGYLLRRKLFFQLLTMRYFEKWSAGICPQCQIASDELSWLIIWKDWQFACRRVCGIVIFPFCKLSCVTAQIMGCIFHCCMYLNMY
jgi:hypothetical protein